MQIVSIIFTKLHEIGTNSILFMDYEIGSEK